jgi:hypothetical protein
MKKLKKDEQKFVKKKITMKTYLCFKLIFWNVIELECLQNVMILNPGDGTTPFGGIQ